MLFCSKIRYFCILGYNGGMDSMATLGNRVRELREARGLRQEDLEERSGVDSQTISNIEVGRQMPRTQTLMKLAKGLEVRPGDLLG